MLRNDDKCRKAKQFFFINRLLGEFKVCVWIVTTKYSNNNAFLAIFELQSFIQMDSNLVPVLI